MQLLAARSAALRGRLEEAPKTRAWRMRAKVGRRKRWYEVPEEVAPLSFTVYYASDIHGSDRLWRKFVNAGKFYDADVLVMGGDITGKAVVPIVRYNGGLRVPGADRRPDRAATRSSSRSKTGSATAASTPT